MVTNGDRPQAPQPLGVEVRVEALETVIALCGELDIAGRPRFAAVADDLAASATRVVLDLSQLTFSDGAGVRIMHRARCRLRDHEGELTLRQVQPPVRRVLELCGVGDLADLRTATQAISSTRDRIEPLVSAGPLPLPLSQEAVTAEPSATIGKAA